MVGVGMAQRNAKACRTHRRDRAAGRWDGGRHLYGAALLFVYALGRGVPIVLAGTFTGVLKGFQAFGRWSAIIEKVSGVIIIGVGIYFVWSA
jgi:cytochrome c biogenesis protein CcdA